MTPNIQAPAAEQERPVAWFIGVLLGLVVILLVSLLGSKLPWPIAYVAISGVILSLGATAPRHYRALAVILAITIVLNLWLNKLALAIINQSGLLKNAPQNMRELISGAAAVTIAVLLVGAATLGGLLFASEFVLAFRGIFGLNRGQALRVLASNGFGLQYPYLIIEDGEERTSKPKGVLAKIGGPGLVIVRPANAVVFERMGRVTQIVGPGTTQTRLFEFYKGIVQLRPRWIDLAASEVFTQDGVPLKLSGGVSARIEPAHITEALIQSAGGRAAYAWASTHRDILPGDFPVYQDSVFRAVYIPSGPDWEKSLAGAALAVISDRIGRRRLQDIFGEPVTGLPAAQQREIEIMEAEALQDLRAFVHNWGVHVTGVEIARLEPPPEIAKRVVRRWGIAAEQQTIQHLGTAEADAVRSIENSKAAVTQTLLDSVEQAVQNVNQVLGAEETRRFIDVLNTALLNMGHDTTGALRYIEVLEKISQNPNARIMVAPPSQQMTLEQHE